MRSWQWLAVCWRFGRTCAPLPEAPELPPRTSDVPPFSGPTCRTHFHLRCPHRATTLRVSRRKRVFSIQMARCAAGGLCVASSRTGWRELVGNANESDRRKCRTRSSNQTPLGTPFARCGPGLFGRSRLRLSVRHFAVNSRAGRRTEPPSRHVRRRWHHSGSELAARQRSPTPF